MRLYQLPSEVESVQALIEQQGGEITPELEAALEELAEVAASKADGIAAWIRELRADARAEKDEAAHFARRKQSHENLADRLSKIMIRTLNGLGIDRLKGSRFTIAARRASQPSVRWEGPGEIPEGFRRVTIEPDGDAIRAALKAGTLPEGFAVNWSQWLDIR